MRAEEEDATDPLLLRVPSAGQPLSGEWSTGSGAGRGPEDGESAGSCGALKLSPSPPILTSRGCGQTLEAGGEGGSEAGGWTGRVNRGGEEGAWLAHPLRG